METDRPHRSNSSSTIATTSTTASTSELFICFTSRFSSSNHSTTSMKLPSSKSILSPGRPRDPSSQISLSTSLSRRLRTNGSLKGGQASPMFPPGGSSAGKKKGCAFDNPEPSSPKVTCIGQVRVKSKMQGRKIKKRRGRGKGEVSFRNNRSFAGGEEGEEAGQCCASRGNGKWVHLPLTICEGLRAFGSEFNCFLPCRSGSCVSGEESKEEKPAGEVRCGGVGENHNHNNGGGFCGAVFTRWLVAVEDGEGKGRELELVVGGEERIGNDREIRGEDGFLERGRSYRRHVFEEIEFKEEKLVGGGNEEEGGRVSICIPPKNALLLMRCRSDPVKMAALANKCFEAPLPCKDDEDEDEDEEEEEEAEADDKGNEEEEKEEEEERQEVGVRSEDGEGKLELEAEVIELETEKLVSCEANEEVQSQGEKQQVISLVSLLGGEEEESQETSPKSFSEVLKEEQEEEEIDQGEVTQEEALSSDTPLHGETAVDPDEVIQQAQENSPIKEEEEENKLIGDVEEAQVASSQEEEEEISREGSAPRKEEDLGPEKAEMSLEKETISQPVPEQPLLPDCLLLMMCEPKLSMEVSKETWVCGTDFIRWLPGGRAKQHAIKKSDGGDDAEKKKRAELLPPSIVVQNNNNTSSGGNNNENNNKEIKNNEKVQFQPPRSSCYYPARPPVKGGESMAAVIEKKLVGGKAGYEPFVLTRCKSEPMRTAAAKLVPQDACFWKNRKLEPAAATLGVGAAGVGF